jgi:hypothetical protein
MGFHLLSEHSGFQKRFIQNWGLRALSLFFFGGRGVLKGTELYCFEYCISKVCGLLEDFDSDISQ